MSLKHPDADDPGFILYDDCRLLLELFQKAIATENPALFLHKSKTRSLLFRVESLLRLLESLDHAKPVKRALKAIKKLEDTLGVISDHEELYDRFSKNKSVSNSQLNYFLEKRNAAAVKMNRDLITNEFYQETFNTLINRFNINFNYKRLVGHLEKTIRKELRVVRQFYTSYTDGFKNIEEDVHEMRRKLRWISIYGQSLKGIIVLKDTDSSYSWEKELLKKDQVSSKYNQLPVDKKFKAYILVDRKAFYAFNAVINQLGKIKDDGLGRKALKRSIRKTDPTDAEKAKEKMTKELNLTRTKHQLLEEAYQLMNRFFVKWGIDEQLMKGVSVSKIEAI